MNIRLPTTICLGFALSISSAQAAPLKARDINGVRLGMSQSEVGTVLRSPFKQINRDPSDRWYAAESEGSKYLLKFTVLGRLWSMEMFQPLGRFQPDESFKKQMLDKLVLKYGTPSFTKGAFGGATWEDRKPGDPNNPQRGGLIAEDVESWVGCCPAKLNIAIHSGVIKAEDEAAQNAPLSKRALDSTKF